MAFKLKNSPLKQLWDYKKHPAYNITAPTDRARAKALTRDAERKERKATKIEEKAETASQNYGWMEKAAERKRRKASRKRERAAVHTNRLSNK